MSVTYCGLVVLFRSSISVLIFCLAVQSVVKRGMLKFPNVVVDYSVSPLKSMSLYFMYYVALLHARYIFRIAMFSR